MKRASLAFIIGAIAPFLSCLPARADACSDAWFYTSMATTGERDLKEYMGEGGTQTARSDFDLVVHNIDRAARTVDKCRQPGTVAKFAFADAERWHIGFTRGWVPARDAARHVHDSLTRLKAIQFDRRDAAEFNAVQISDKALFKAAGLAWEAVK